MLYRASFLKVLASFGFCSCVSFWRDSVGGNTFLARVILHEFTFVSSSFARSEFGWIIRTSSRGTAHGITTLANKASDVMGNSWRCPTVYLQRIFETIDKLSFRYGSRNSLLRNVYHVGKFNLSVCATVNPTRPLRLIKACTSSSPYQLSSCSLRNHISVCFGYLL